MRRHGGRDACYTSRVAEHVPRPGPFCSAGGPRLPGHSQLQRSGTGPQHRHRRQPGPRRQPGWRRRHLPGQRQRVCQRKRSRHRQRRRQRLCHRPRCGCGPGRRLRLCQRQHRRRLRPGTGGWLACVCAAVWCHGYKQPPHPAHPAPTCLPHPVPLCRPPPRPSTAAWLSPTPWPPPWPLAAASPPPMPAPWPRPLAATRPPCARRWRRRRPPQSRRRAALLPPRPTPLPPAPEADSGSVIPNLQACPAAQSLQFILLLPRSECLPHEQNPAD